MLRSVILALVLASSPLSILGQDCDPGWSGSISLGACYLLGSVTDGVVGTTYTWGDGLSYCVSLRSGATLAEIKTAEQQSYVQGALLSSGPDHVWIGGQDINLEGTFEWGSPGSGDYFDYTAWANTEPNNGDNGENEDCVSMWDYVGFLWNDVPCGNYYEPLCMYIPDGVTTTTTVAPPKQ